VNLNKMATRATIHVGYEERDGNQHQAAPVNFRETLRGKHVIVQWAYFSRFLSKYDIALIKTGPSSTMVEFFTGNRPHVEKIIRSLLLAIRSLMMMKGKE
jgi:hypothetical protein